MRKITKNEDAVSEIVGEMLMLTLVLILLAVFSASLSNYLPPPRDPSVTIKMQNGTNISLYHKGGDWVKSSDLQVIVEIENQANRYPLNDPHITVVSSLDNPDIFDLGDRIDINRNVITGTPTIKLVTSRVVLFNGRLPQ